MKKAFILLILILNNSAYCQEDFQSFLHNENRSEKKNFYLKIDDNLKNIDSIPISIIKGKEKGPVFSIVAGVHGYEYPPIIAAQELIQEINPELLTGTLLIIPMANPGSFFNRSPFKNPQDNINLNRTFPGNKNGSITEKIAYILTTEIIAKSDVFLDIHGGDANEDLTPFVCYYNNDQNLKKTKQTKKLAEISGFKHVVSYPYTLKKNTPAKYAFKQAVQDDKIALSIECGKLGTLQEKPVKMIKTGVYNMLAEMKMYKNNSSTTTSFVTIPKQSYLKAKMQGIFTSTYKAGDTVTKNEVVGYIKNVFGKTIAELKAPNSGIILYKIGTPPVNINETVMCIGFGFEKH